MIKLDKQDTNRIQIWGIYILIILNIIAFILLSDKIYFRLDMTEGKKFSISKPTKELLKKINKVKPLIFEYYYNDKFKEHSAMALIAQYVEDILNEYKRISKGTVDVIIKTISYDKDAALISDLENIGITPFPLSEREKAESKTLLGISGILIKYGDDVSVVPVIYNDVGFEYMLDTEIDKILEKDRGTIGIMFNVSQRNFDQDYTFVKYAAENEFSEIKMINSGENIPPEVSVLFIIGGENITDYDLFQIDQFLMNGGKAFIALGGVNIIINPQYGMFGFPNQSNLFNLLASYGIKINIDMIGDNDSFNPYMERDAYGYSPQRYPIWPKIISSNINKDHPAVDGLESFNLFWASSIDIDDKIKQNAVSLFHTTEKSWSEKENFQLQSQQYMYPIQQGEKAFDMAYAIQGKLESYFKDKEIPENKEGNVSFTGNKIDSGETQLVVIGDDIFLWDNLIEKDQNAQIFILNSLDWFSKDHSLIEIRKKGRFTKSLDKVTNETQFKIRQKIIIIVSTIIIPFLFCLLALLLYVIRQIKNNKIKSLY